ncbi:putative lipid II flippase FtsW [Succinimonas amylolytica]|uniref:putative lipid II flippase FtsW n=1 Tax=Succinimonas amylolytica TaxID=83769 RepID=UPI0023A90274
MRFLEAFFGRESEEYDPRGPLYDRALLVIVFLLLALCLVMIYGASIYVGEVKMHDSYYFIGKQFIFMALGFICALGVMQIPTKFWLGFGRFYLPVSALLLCALPLICGVSVKGASRWISLGVFNFQPSELVKLVWIIFVAGYIQRHHEAINKIRVFIYPFLFFIPFAVLLYLQRDFGSIVVLLGITFGMLFIAGGGLAVVIVSSFLAGLCLLPAVVLNSYRVARIMSYLDPWKDAENGGYQLTMGLMAYGRGGAEGQGLGNSVIKMNYIPEPHTDFIMAIWGEDAGFVGVALVVILEFLLVAKCCMLGFTCMRSKKMPNYIQGFIAFGVGLWFTGQTFINVGVSSGLLPTKGLTLPLISYGGSSLICMLMAMAVVLRISYERRKQYFRLQELEIRTEKGIRKSLSRHGGGAGRRKTPVSGEAGANGPGSGTVVVDVPEPDTAKDASFAGK